MTLTRQDVEKVARGLSPAMRLMIFALKNGQPSDFVLGPTGWGLIDRGLAFVNELGAHHLTDDGHAVRTFLQEKDRSNV